MISHHHLLNGKALLYSSLQRASQSCMNIVQGQNAKYIYVVGVTLYARHINGNTEMSDKIQMISWSRPVLRQQFEYGNGSADIHK